MPFLSSRQFSCARNINISSVGGRHALAARTKSFEHRLAHEMLKTGTDSRIIQQAIDAIAGVLPASFILLRAVSFGHPEETLCAWTPHDDRPPMEINLPVSKAEHVVYGEQRPVFVEDARSERAGSDDA